MAQTCFIGSMEKELHEQNPCWMSVFVCCSKVSSFAGIEFHREQAIVSLCMCFHKRVSVLVVRSDVFVSLPDFWFVSAS